MPISPDLPRPREHRQPSVVQANLHQILLAFPFVDPRIKGVYPDKEAYHSAGLEATRAVRAPWIGQRDGATEFITHIFYNTETGEIGKPAAVFETGEWSLINTRLRVEGGDYNIPTPEMKYTLSLQLPQDDSLVPHAFHELDRGSTGDAGQFVDVGRLILPQRLYQDGSGTHRRFEFKNWSSFGDLIIMQTISEFNKTYGPELLGVSHQK